MKALEHPVGADFSHVGNGEFKSRTAVALDALALAVHL
jgi:hypothetical protein